MIAYGAADDGRDFSFRLEEDLPADCAMIYYSIDGFFQNHRRYWNSRTFVQYRGTPTLLLHP